MEAAGALLFWLHLTIIVLAVVSGFFLPILLVFTLIVLHKIHLIIFGDCLLTLMKRRVNTITADEDFIQYTANRFFKKTPTRKQSKTVQWSIYAATLSLSASRFLM